MLEILKDKDKIVNRFPGIQGLAHKDIYASIMQIGAKLNEEVYDFVPPQFYFPKGREEFKEYQKSHPKAIFIAKPSASAEGNGILLFRE